MEDERVEGLYVSLVSLGVGVFVTLLFGLMFGYNLHVTGKEFSEFSLRILLGMNAVILLISMTGFICGVYRYKHGREKEVEVEEDNRIGCSIQEERAEFQEVMNKWELRDSSKRS
jgi:hypothetical protein